MVPGFIMGRSKYIAVKIKIYLTWIFANLLDLKIYVISVTMVCYNFVLRQAERRIPLKLVLGGVRNTKLFHFPLVLMNRLNKT